MSTEVSSNASGQPGQTGKAAASKSSAPEKMSRESVTIIATLLVATFVVILNETIMNVALQRLMVDLGVDRQHRAVAHHGLHAHHGRGHPDHRLPAAALLHPHRLHAGHGRCSAPARCWPRLAPGFEVLLLGRIVQAGGTAIMLPLLMTTILTLVPLGAAARDGQRQHRHLGGAGDRAHRLRADPAVLLPGASCSSSCCRSHWPPWSSVPAYLTNVGEPATTTARLPLGDPLPFRPSAASSTA